MEMSGGDKGGLRDKGDWTWPEASKRGNS